MIEFDETLFIKALQGKCTPAEELEVVEWLNQSEENRELFARLKMLWQARKMDGYARNASFLKEINGKIDRVERQSRKYYLNRFMKYAAVFAGLLCVALVYLLVLTKPTVKYTTRLVPSSGKVEVVMLSDGSRVWLNNGAELSYPDVFDRSKRIVKLKGEGFFEIAKDVSKPFIVETGSLSVKVTGTSFNVNTSAVGRKLQTVLVSGSVSLLDHSGDVIIVLKPGQMAESDKVTGKTVIRKVNTRDYTLWQEGMISFEKARLDDILIKIEQVYKVELIYDSVKISKARGKYNFVFRRDQDLDTVLNMLKYIAPAAKVVKVKDKN